MKRFNEDDKNGVKRFSQNYGDNLMQKLSSSTSKDLLYSPPLSQYYNGITAQQQQSQQQQQQQQQQQSPQLPLNKDQQQFKYTSVPMYPPPSIEQGRTYYNSFYNNSNWRYPNSNTSGTTIGGSSFTYDPSQPPPPLPKLNTSDSPAPPPLPPLPPGDPPYYPTPPGSIMNSTSTLQSKENQQQQQSSTFKQPFPPIDPTQAPPIPPPHHPSNIPNTSRRRPMLARGGSTFRGGALPVGGVGGLGRGDRINALKRTAYPFKKSKVPFIKMSLMTSQSGQTQMNSQKKLTNKSQGNLRNNANDGDDDGDDNLSHIQVNKKAKRKPMSTRYPRKIEWDRGDALKALALEKEYNKLQRNSMLILKFPDPELNKNIVKEYSPYIESVHFQQPSTPRYCFVQLKEGVDIEKVREELCQIPFGVGKIVAERKRMHSEEDDTVNPEDIDPYTLYIGNLPTTITVKTVKEHFPNSRRIDIGYAQRMRYTRYAFIRYETVEDAMEAYRNTFNLLIESRSLIVRFRRQKGNVGLPGESRPSNPKKETASNQNKEQNSESTMDTSKTDTYDDGTGEIANDSINANQDDQDPDLHYICGIPSKFDDLDTKENVLEESRRLADTRQRNNNGLSSFEQTVIKQEPSDEYDGDDDDDRRHRICYSGQVKEEPPDRLYEDYDDLDMQDDEDDDDFFEYDKRGPNQYDQREQKPDVKILPFPIFNEDSPDLMRSTSYRISKNAAAIGVSESRNQDTDKSLYSKSKKPYRDDLDELFERMNSEDDDLSF